MITKALRGFALGCAVFLAAPVLAQTTVKHAAGETTVPARPKTVAVFDLAALDTLDALGVAVAGVPTGPKPALLAKFAPPAYAGIGTLFEPDYEALNALAPDLVIVGGRSQPKYRDVAKIAPTIDLTLDGARPFDSARENVALLGRIFGREAEAKALLDRLDASTASVKAKAPQIGRGLLILTVANRMSTYGPGSRFGMLHEVFGVVPAAPDLKAGIHGQPVTFEFVRKVDPDWLFVIDRDAAINRSGNAEAMLDNEVIRETTAWRKKQVVYLDAGNWYLAGGGIRALQASVDQLDRAFSR